MNESMKIILAFLAVLLWNGGLLYLGDSNPARKRILNFFMLCVLLVLFAPLLFTAIVSFGGNPWSENGSGAILWLYIILGPLGILAYLILLGLKIYFAVKANQPKRDWFRFLGIFLLAPFFIIAGLGMHQQQAPKGPYAGYSSMGLSNSEEYPDMLAILLTYTYPDGVTLKATKSFLVDPQYDPSVTNDDEEALAHAKKYFVWVYYSEAGDTLKTELYRNDSLIATKDFLKP